MQVSPINREDNRHSELHGTLDGEATNSAIRHFKHKRVQREFTVFTGHKSLTLAFKWTHENALPCQARQLDFLDQSMTDIPHVAGQDNIAANTLSRVETVRVPIDYEALARIQRNESGPRIYLKKITGVTIEVYCNPSIGRYRPFITPEFRKFNRIHIHARAVIPGFMLHLPGYYEAVNLA